MCTLEGLTLFTDGQKLKVHWFYSAFFKQMKDENVKTSGTSCRWKQRERGAALNAFIQQELANLLLHLTPANTTDTRPHRVQRNGFKQASSRCAGQCGVIGLKLTSFASSEPQTGCTEGDVPLMTTSKTNISYFTKTGESSQRVLCSACPHSPCL